MKFNTKKTILKIYLLVSIIMAIGFAVWRTVLLKEYCNPYDMTFQDGARPALQAYEYTLLAVCAVIASCVFFAKKTNFRLFGARSSTTSVAICAFCGFMIVAVALLALIYYPEEIFDFSDKAFWPYRIFYLISLVFMIGSALYFLGRASIALKNSPSIATLSLSLPCFCIAYLVASYFNSERPLLDFNRTTSTLAFIAVLIFMLSEARLANDCGNYPLRFAASLISMVCICAYVIPLLLLSSFWEMHMSLSLLTEVSLAAILFYVVFASFNAIRTLKEA